MEKRAIFRDYQEQTAEDHTNVQLFAQQSLDHLVFDAVTGSRKYAGFNCQKTAQAEVQLAVGRFYDNDGAVFVQDSVTVQSMISYLAASSKRYVTVSVYGVESETDTVERDYLVDVDTDRTEPRAVTTTYLRGAVLAFNQGTESADPQPPALSVNHVGIANILLDTVQVVSVTMLTENEVQSTEELDSRTSDLEDWKESISAAVGQLGAELAALQMLVKAAGQSFDIIRIYKDLGELKEKAGLPATYADYGADFFLTLDDSDTDNSQALGYDCKVEEGIRFSDANADEFTISLFNPYDANAKLDNSSGLLLPAYTEKCVLQIGPYNSDIDISQYGFQTFTTKEGKMSKSRMRFGGTYNVCSNGVQWWSAYGQPAAANLLDFTTSELVTSSPEGHWERYDYWWFDSWNEPYWYVEETDHVIVGAQVAESFLAPNDMWLTKIGFYVTSKAAAANINVSLVELTSGVPDLEKCILQQAYDESDIVVGWNRMAIRPTFLARGKRYALVLTSNAAHRLGVAYGSSYRDGTFFYSTDTVYYLGDVTKDIMIELWAADFNSSQVTIQFGPINLDGGIRSIDLMARTVVPASCSLVFEIRLPGGVWQPLTKDNVDALSTAPAMFEFRGRFTCSGDAAPGIMLGDSVVHVARPKTSLTHVSEKLLLGALSININVELVVEGFDETPHDFACVLHNYTTGGSPTTINPGSIVTVLEDLATKRYRRTFHFSPVACNQFSVVTTASTNSAASMFHVAERLHYSL